MSTFPNNVHSVVFTPQAQAHHTLDMIDAELGVFLCLEILENEAIPTSHGYSWADRHNPHWNHQCLLPLRDAGMADHRQDHEDGGGRIRGSC